MRRKGETHEERYNSTEHAGIRIRGDRFQAVDDTGRRVKHLGLFDTLEEAVAAREAWLNREDPKPPVETKQPARKPTRKGKRQAAAQKKAEAEAKAAAEAEASEAEASEAEE